MLSTPGERTPLKQVSKHQQQHDFATGRWFLALFLSCSGLALLGCLVHKRHGQHERHARQLEKLEKHQQVAPAKPPPPIPPSVEFLKCNPSVALPDAVSVSGGGAFLKGGNSPLAGRGCGAEQAAMIRAALQQVKYDFQAVDPQNGVSVGDVLQTLLAMRPQTLTHAFANYNKIASGKRELGVLVKFFAWGMPIHVQELWASVGGKDVIAALTQCNIIRKCGSSQMYTSSVQLFPVPKTNVIVATDWALPSSVDLPVEAVDQNVLYLADNMPHAGGMDVLDLASSSGVLGLIAASRGAKHVAMLQPNPRAARFAQFSSWLNGMSDKVQISQGPLEPVTIYRTYSSKFYLVLAHPAGNTAKKDSEIRFVLKASQHLLSHRGSLVMAFQGQSCVHFSRKYDESFCGDSLYGDLTGSIVCRSSSKQNSSVDAIQDLRQQEQTTPSQEGIVYAWTSAEQARSGRSKSCGQFTTSSLFRLDGPEDGSRACAYARVGMTCPVSPSVLDLALQGYQGKDH